MINPHAVELTSLVLLVPLLLRGLYWKRRWSPAGRLLSRFAARRLLAALSVGVAALAIRAALLPLHPRPAPGVMDEYSYLLAADTFASGRAANRPHPFWIHFETFCELSLPKYASKYPPAQGLAMAAGILLAHSPWVGVWLSIAVMCASMVWMLQGWVPPRWAFLGGILVLLRIAIGSYWIDSYWGGAVAATGGALLFGALPRLLFSQEPRRPRLRDSLALGIGLAILANSRPFEGLMVAAPGLIALALWAFRRGWPAVRALAPMLAVLGFAAVAMLAYNQAVTGSPWHMPYQVHEARYAVSPLFLFMKLRPEPVYNHAVMRTLWAEFERDLYLNNFRFGLVAASLTKLKNLWSFFLGPQLTIPLLALPWAWRQKRFRLIYISLGVMLLAQLTVIDILPHYSAPATALIYLTVIQCLRYIRTSRRVGLAVAQGIPVVLAGTVVLFYSLEAGGAIFLHEHYSRYFTRPGDLERARILMRLEASPGRHLVMVRYGPNHEAHAEWVYNRADIDGAKVVWAREMDADRNRALIRYFSKRQVWLLEPDAPNPELKPYAERSAQ